MKIDWLEQLRIQIIEEKDVENFDDIIKCYQNGLLRAGFMMAWLMLIESLKRKIVDLVNKGVKVAVIEFKTIEETEKAMHSNDEVIWKAAFKCDLITEEENCVLEMLWKKRCVMSHPYMPKVSESDFRYMVENLVSMSLSRSLMWSKNMINDFFDDIKKNLFLIPDYPEEKKDLADRVLTLIPEKQWPFFWKTLFYEFSLSLDNVYKKHQMMLRILAIQFVILPGLNINDTKFTLATQIKNYCSVCWNIFFNKKAWQKLDGDFQAQLFRFLKDNKIEAKKVLWLVKGLIEHDDELDEKYVDNYYAALALYDVTDMQGYYIDKERFLNILYKEKIGNNQFYDQGDFIDMLNSMNTDDIAKFTSDQLRKLGKFVEICCFAGTYKAQNFVTAHNIWSENLFFAKGFVVGGLSNENGELYVLERHLEYVLQVLYHTKEANRPEIIKALDELPVIGTVSEAMFCRKIRLLVGKYFEDDSDTDKALVKVLNKYCKC